MSIKVNSLEELAEKLDDDIRWRRKEIIDIQTYCQEHRNPPVLLRSAFILCCAHFEGAIKYASNAYIAYISGQNIIGKELLIEISSILIRKKKRASFSSQKVKLSVVSDVLRTYDELLENKFYIKLNEDGIMSESDEIELPLSTGGNPTPEVLREISKILDIDYEDLFQLRELFINSELLKPRHAVAHGERRPISEEELTHAKDFVLEIIEKYKDSIVDAATHNRHLRNR